MALTHTPEAEIGTACPDFELPGTDGRSYSLANFSESKVLVVMFICNHCPYVIAVEDRLIELGRTLKGKGVSMVAISSNDAQRYPEDSFDKMKARALEKNYPFPYLYDETQRVAKSFGAVCTPDIFVYNEQRELAYRGRLDDSWKEPAKVTKEELRLAIEDLLANREVSFQPTPSMGCSIKWKELD